MPMLNIGHLPPDWMENEHLVQKLGWQMVNLPMEVANAGANFAMFEAGHNPSIIPERIRVLEHLFKHPGRVFSMEECPRGKGPIILVGSGSSLDSVVKDLKDWKGAIICSTSHVSTLIHYGRPPEYVVCMDPRVATLDTELEAPDCGDAVLLGHPSIPMAYVERWLTRARGNIYLARIMEPTYEWYSHHLASLYPWINHVMLPMIDSGAAMLSLATWLGYNPIYLIGLDYGGPRFQRFDYKYETQTWAPDVATSGYVAAATGNYGGLTAAGAMAYSSRGSLMSAYMQMANTKYRQRIYNMSDVSVLKQFPFMPWSDVKEAKEPSGWTDAVRDKTLEDIEVYLSVWDTFLVPTNGGFGGDFQTYIVLDEAMMVLSILSYNRQIRNNKREFAKIEAQFNGTPLLTLIRNKMVSVEAGDILLRGTDEFGEWNWREMEEVDIGPVLSQIVGIEFPNQQEQAFAIKRAMVDIERQCAKVPVDVQSKVRAALLGPVLARRRYLLERAKEIGYEKPSKQRVILTQKMVDELRAYVEKTPHDEHARLKLLAMEQGLQRVGQPLPPTGLYPMPDRSHVVEGSEIREGLERMRASLPQALEEP